MRGGGCPQPSPMLGVLGTLAAQWGQTFMPHLAASRGHGPVHLGALPMAQHDMVCPWQHGLLIYFCSGLSLLPG